MSIQTGRFTAKYGFNNFFIKFVNEMLYDRGYKPDVVQFQDTAIYSFENEYLKRMYCYETAEGHSQLFDRIQLLADHYSRETRLQFQHPMMVVTNTKQIFLRRLKRIRKTLNEEGSSDDTASAQSSFKEFSPASFLHSLASSSLSQNSAFSDISLEEQHDVYLLPENEEEQKFHLKKLPNNFILQMEEYDEKEVLRQYKHIMSNVKQGKKNSTGVTAEPSLGKDTDKNKRNKFDYLPPKQDSKRDSHTPKPNARPDQYYSKEDIAKDHLSPKQAHRKNVPPLPKLDIPKGYPIPTARDERPITEMHFETANQFNPLSERIQHLRHCERQSYSRLSPRQTNLRQNGRQGPLRPNQREGYARYFKREIYAGQSGREGFKRDGVARRFQRESEQREDYTNYEPFIQERQSSYIPRVEPLHFVDPLQRHQKYVILKESKNEFLPRQGRLAGNNQVEHEGRNQRPLNQIEPSQEYIIGGHNRKMRKESEEVEAKRRQQIRDRANALLHKVKSQGSILTQRGHKLH